MFKIFLQEGKSLEGDTNIYVIVHTFCNKKKYKKNLKMALYSIMYILFHKALPKYGL